MENSGSHTLELPEKTDGTNQHQNETGTKYIASLLFFRCNEIQNPTSDKIGNIPCAASDRIHDRTMEDMASLFRALPHMPCNKTIK